jgi:hypothetical protein
MGSCRDQPLESHAMAYKTTGYRCRRRSRSKSKGNEAAGYLQDLVTQIAAQGWAFYPVNSIGVQVQPGCLASLFGASA